MSVTRGVTGSVFPVQKSVYEEEKTNTSSNLEAAKNVARLATDLM